MPLLPEATFMPFRDIIISDRLVMPYNILVGDDKVYICNCKKEWTNSPVALKSNLSE